MTFATDLAALPFAARTTEAKGFLPPVLRTMGHLLFVTAAMAGTAEWETLLSEEDALNELRHAQGHWDVVLASENLSVATTTALGNINKALTSAIAEYPTWDREKRANNLRDLINRIVAFSGTLDREAFGIRDSDPGQNL